MKAWVVFSGQTDVPWLRVLRPGFRHCFVLLHDGSDWLSVDPMLHYTDVQIHRAPPGFDLPRWLESRGQIVVSATIHRGLLRPAPWSLFSCVEAVKRVLGLRAPLVFTPWQLYRHLTEKENHHGKPDLAAESAVCRAKTFNHYRSGGGSCRPAAGRPGFRSIH